ncbi:MAG: hypothetical protein WAX77_09195 [Methylococcaceae bacterium]
MKKRKVGILILHGIGNQEKDYSMELQVNIENVINGVCAVQEVVYADVFGRPDDENNNNSKREKKSLESSYSWQRITRCIRKQFIYILGDATSYKDKVGYINVHKRLSKAIAILKGKLDDDAPIIVVAHSLGVMVISDYIYDEQKGINRTTLHQNKIADNLKAIVSFGCNIPLFETGHEETVSIKKPNLKFRWLNFYSPFDVLGYKMSNYYDREYYNKKPPDFIEDREICSGGILCSWNIFSHISYWRDEEIASTIAELIK